MSMIEILQELPKLKTEERHFLLERLNELEFIGTEETPEMLAAIDEADASSPQDDLSVEKVRENIKRWAHSK